MQINRIKRRKRTQINIGYVITLYYWKIIILISKTIVRFVIYQTGWKTVQDCIKKQDLCSSCQICSKYVILHKSGRLISPMFSGNFLLMASVCSSLCSMTSFCWTGSNKRSDLIKKRLREKFLSIGTGYRSSKRFSRMS